MYTEMTTHLYDVAVIGAGPAGSAAAHYLAKAGLAVLLLDKSTFPRDKTCGDGLAPRSLAVLQDMGILATIEQSAHRINALEFFSRSGKKLVMPARTRFFLPDHLLVIPRFKLDATIFQSALELGASFEGQAHVTGLEEKEDRVHVLAERNGRPVSFEARVVIVATGANVGLLQQVGLLRRMPEPMRAARVYFEGVRGLADRIQIHHIQDLAGYGWVFPISADAANVGVGLWQAGPRKRPKSLRRSLDDLLASQSMRLMLGNATQIGPVKSYPLRSDFATAPTVCGRILAVGEAAGLVNPLTGEGIDFALESGRLAAGFLASLSAQGLITPQSLVYYDRLLRKNFQSIFRYFGLLRTLLASSLVMDGMFSVLERSTRIARLASDIILSQPKPMDLLHLGACNEI